MRMPFGKYKGEPIGEIPDDYLEWCLANVTRLDPKLRRAILAELGRSGPVPAIDIAPAVAKVEEGLKTWYRRASLKYHPDRGGSNQAQVVVNECYESLRELVGEIGGAR